MDFAVMLFSVIVVLCATYIVDPVGAASRGLCFKTNPSKNNVLPVFPEKVQIDNEGNLNVEKWSLDNGEEVRCACIDESDAHDGCTNLSLHEYDDTCPCNCPSEVEPSHEIEISSHEKYHSLAMGFKKPLFLAGMNVYVFEEDNSFFVLSRHSKLLPQKSLKVDLNLYKALLSKYSENFKNLSSFYKKMDEQKTIFETIIKNHEIPLPDGDHKDQKSYLILQQLVLEEHMMEKWKPLTHYYFNLIPVWNEVAVHRHDILNQILTRHQEGCTNYQLDIVSGTSGEYVYQDKVTIPYYLWNLYTVVNSKYEKKSIFLIIHNDLSLEHSNRMKKICEISVCEEYDSFRGIVNGRKTFVYCCTADENTTKTILKNSTSQNLIMKIFSSKNAVKQRIETFKKKMRESNIGRSDGKSSVGSVTTAHPRS